MLEYLSERSVQRLYAGLLRRAPGSLVLVVEPIAPGPPPSDRRSIAHGEELSFSHQHAWQMQLAGLRVLFDERIGLGDQTMQVACAEVPPSLMSS